MENREAEIIRNRENQPVPSKNALSYTNELQRKRFKILFDEQERLRELFFKYYLFYTENHPNSNYGIKYANERIELIIGEESLEDVFATFSYLDLIKTHYILNYSKMEINSNDMKERDDYGKIVYLIKQLLPKDKWDAIEDLEKLSLAQYNIFKRGLTTKGKADGRTKREIQIDKVKEELKELSKEIFYCCACNHPIEFEDKPFKAVIVSSFRCNNESCKSYKKEQSFGRVSEWSRQVRHYIEVNSGKIESIECPKCKKGKLYTDDFIHVSVELAIMSKTMEGIYQINMNSPYNYLEAINIKAKKDYPEFDELRCSNDNCKYVIKKYNIEKIEKVPEMEVVRLL